MPAKIIAMPGAAPENEGERTVVELLRAQLPASYTLIPNIEIRTPGRPPYEYDLVVIAPHAVYAVESKAWLGGIVGDDYTWTVAGIHRRTSPVSTINNKARVLKSRLKEATSLFEDIWVQSVVAIVDAQGELNIRGTMRDIVMRHTELANYLSDASRLGARAGDWRRAREALERRIEYVSHGRPLGKQRYGAYEIVETLSRRDRVAEYKARNYLLASAQFNRLRVFSYDPYLPEPEQTRRKAIIQRETEAIQEIGAHPNLIAVHTLFPAPEDPNLFVEVTEWSDVGSLRTLMSPGTPLTLERKLEIAENIASGLKAAHTKGVIHRDVRPENVLIGRDGQAKVMNFDYARIPLPGGVTVGPPVHDPDEPRAYLAPELALPTHVPTAAADIYALGMILFELLVGVLPFDQPEDANKQATVGGGPSEYGVPDVPPRLNELVRAMTRVNPADRIQSIDAVIAELQAIRKLPSATQPPAAPPSEPTPPVERPYDPAVFQVGDKIQDKYVVQKVLSAGGFGQVYKVFDPIFERVWALKIFTAPGREGEDSLRAEIGALVNLTHSNIVRVHDWGILKPSGRLFMVSEFVDGEDLRRYASPSAEQRLQLREAVEAVVGVLDALEAIHPPVERIEELEQRNKTEGLEEEEYQELRRLSGEGLLHRDIKPENIILTKSGQVKLIDFNIARRAAHARLTYIGTPNYMLPTVGSQMATPWSPANDLFALAIVLYELVTGQHPYPENNPSLGNPPIDPKDKVPDLHPTFAALLLQAVDHHAGTVYRSASRFRADLRALNGLYRALPAIAPAAPLTLEPWEVERPNYNPFVTRLLRLYSQARRDNGGTRGLDELASLTYVDTRLDRTLRPAILEGHYRLVIITGNAGDGKTAFIKSLEKTVKASSATIDYLSANASSFSYNGIRFITNYDGSQDEGAERANDLVLREFFSSFTDDRFAAPDVSSTHVIAINEGRLLDFFAPSLANGANLGQLGATLRTYFEPEQAAALPPWLLVIDLNQRSVVAADPDAPDSAPIFERQLQALLKPELWAACDNCGLRERCFIRNNAATLADPASGPAVRERLRALFEIVHLRRLMHITMRDLRSALAWLIARDHTCDDVDTLLDQAPSPATLLQLLYVNAFAADDAPAPGSGDDRLVALLRQIDVAEVSNPAADRALHFHGIDDVPMLAFDVRADLARTWLSEWSPSSGWEANRSAQGIAEHRHRHAIMRRIAFFERRGDEWQTMLPYQQLTTFRRATRGDAEVLEQTRLLLIEAISRAEGAQDPTLARTAICLRSGQGSGRLKSFRLFPADDFQLSVPTPRGGRYVEYAADRLLLTHRPRNPEDTLAGSRPAELIVSLDLLDLLAQIREGFTPSTDALSGFFINLVIFKNVLAHLPYRRLLLTRDDGQYYEVVQTSVANIALRKLDERPTDATQP